MPSNPARRHVIVERTLLRRAIQGDDEAFVSLALIHSDEVYAIARNLSASQADAFHLTRRTFQLAVRRRTRFACLIMSAYLFGLSACIGDTEARQPRCWIH
jgi:hypothetical protein